MTEEAYTLSEKIRGVYSNGMESAEKYQELDTTQPETYFLSTNLLNGILEASEFHYKQFMTGTINQFEEVEMLLLVLFCICGFFPWFFISLIVLFAFVLRSNLVSFLNSIYNLTEMEARNIQAKVIILKRIFKEGIEENLLLGQMKAYNELNEEESNLGVTIGVGLVKKSKSRKKGIAKVKKDEGRKRKDNGAHTGVSSVNFRTIKISVVLIAVMILISLNFLVYYFIEKTRVGNVHELTQAKESIKSHFLEESFFYSVVVGYIATKGTAEAYGENVELSLEDALLGTSHISLFEDMEQLFSSHGGVSEILSEVQNGESCSDLFKGDPYCAEFDSGVLENSFSLAIKSINTNLRSAIEEFRGSEMTPADQKVAIETTLLKEMVLYYPNYIMVIYDDILESFIDVIKEDFTLFYTWHYLLIGILTCLNAFFSIGGAWIVDSLIASDLTEVKEAFRLVPASVFSVNKYLKRFIISASPNAVKRYGVKCFG